MHWPTASIRAYLLATVLIAALPMFALASNPLLAAGFLVIGVGAAFVMANRMSRHLHALCAGTHLAVFIPMREISELRDSIAEADASRTSAQDKLLGLLSGEQAIRDAAASAVRERDDSLATLAHNLRNPLNAIAAAVEVLNHVDASAAVAIRARDIIAQQTLHMARLTHELDPDPGKFEATEHRVSEDPSSKRSMKSSLSMEWPGRLATKSR